MLGIIGAMDVEVNSIKIRIRKRRNQEHCRNWTFTKAPLPARK